MYENLNVDVFYNSWKTDVLIQRYFMTFNVVVRLTG